MLRNGEAIGVPYYRWLAAPVGPRELARAYLADAVRRPRRRPRVRYRLLADEARAHGHRSCDRRIWLIYSSNRWWSVFGKRRSKAGRPGAPAHDDQVRRNFTATGPNRLS